jgi:membrane protease YdiL (CAAX protease family)
MTPDGHALAPRLMDITGTQPASPRRVALRHRGELAPRPDDQVTLTPTDARSTMGRTSPQPTTRGELRGHAARRPVAAFLALVFALAYPVMSLPVLADHGVIPDGWMPRLPGVDTERIAAFLLVFGALLPVAVFMTWAVDGQAGIRALVRRMFRWRVGARWWLLVLLGLPTLTMTFALILGDTLKPVDIFPFVITQIAGLLVNLVLINLWEETAWAGLVQTRVERRHSLVVAAILTAIPFALVHMPLHFIGDISVERLMTALVALLVISVLVRLLIGVVLRGTRDSILAVALVHTLFNRSNNDDGFVAGLLDGQARGLAGLAAVIVLTAIVAIVARRRPTRSHRRALDSTGARALDTPRHQPARISTPAPGTTM